MPKLMDMGMKRKEMYPAENSSPKSEKDYDNEKVYPELRVDGALAEQMGAGDLKKGDLVEQVVRWRVKELSKHEVDGHPAKYSMTLCLEKASDCEDCGEGDDSEEDDSSDDSGEESPAMSYIRGAAKSAE